MFKVMLRTYYKGELIGRVAPIAKNLTEQEAQEKLNEVANNVETTMPQVLERFVRTANELSVFLNGGCLTENCYTIETM